jgi:hypothetical protein
VKQVFNGKLVKLADSGVGVAEIAADKGRVGQFVYFRPRDLQGYSGETWTELAGRGLIPGKRLEIEADCDATGAIHQVSGVRLLGR